MPVLGQTVDVLLNHLLWTSLQAAVLVGIVALIVRLLPRLPTSTCCALWWLVGLQVVIGMCWQAPVRLPLLTPTPSIAAAQVGNQAQTFARLQMVDAKSVRQTAGFDWRSMLTWRDGLAALWLLGVLIQLSIVVRDSRRMRRWLRGANAPDDFLRRQCDNLSRRMGLRRCPRLLVSSAIASPLVMGFMRPVILWPAGQTLTSEETSLALAHELAHVQRGDLWLGCIPAIAQRLLFFHPLVRWAAREHAAHREAACDVRAMQVLGTDPQGYGRLLLHLGVADFGPATLASASSTFRGLKRRLLMLQSAGGSVLLIRGWILVALIALIGLVPYRLVAASPSVVAHLKAGASHDDGAITRPVHCKGPGADDIRFCGSHFLVYTGAARKGHGAVLFDKGKVIIAGDHADVVAADQFYQPGANLLWFRRDGKAYVVRDPAMLQHADAWAVSVAEHLQNEHAPNFGLDKLNRRMGVLNQHMGKLNQQMSALNDQQRTLEDQDGGRIDPKAEADIQTRMAGIEVSIRAQQTQIDALQRSIDARHAELQKGQSSSSDAFRKIPEGLAKLADDALANGSAQEVDQ